MLNWYKDLIEEVRGTITEGVFISRWNLVETYHKVGEKIRQASKDNNENITDLVTKCARDIDVSDRKLWYAVKFFDKYPQLDTVPGGKNISWNKIKTELLTESKVEECTHEKQVTICAKCKKRI